MSEDVQDTELSVASSGWTVAVSVVDWPTSSDTELWSRVTLVTGVVTVTRQVADFSPAFAVMVTLPLFRALTLPLWSTLATAKSELFQVTVLSVASEGLTVATSVAPCPFSIASVVLSRVTDVTGTTFLATVTAQEADLSPAMAATVAVPSFRAVIFPLLSIEMTDSSELVQVTVLSVASAGFTVTMRVVDWPISSVTE